MRARDEWTDAGVSLVDRNAALDRGAQGRQLLGDVRLAGVARERVNLASGDLLFFYTDGCVETENEADEMFGNSRLETLLVSIAAMGPVTPERVLQQVETAVTAFRGTREPFDDATMMAVRIG